MWTLRRLLIAGTIVIIPSFPSHRLVFLIKNRLLKNDVDAAVDRQCAFNNYYNAPSTVTDGLEHFRNPIVCKLA